MASNNTKNTVVLVLGVLLLGLVDTTTMAAAAAFCPLSKTLSPSSTSTSSTAVRRPVPLFASNDDKQDDDEDSSSTPNAPGHATGGGAVSDLPADVQSQLVAYQAHQEAAPKLDWATDVRTLVANNHGFAVMSTHSKAHEGYPGGSVVGFAPDPATGRPLFVFSGMSSHTQDLLVNPKCSLTVAAKDFKSAADGRVNLMGTCQLIKDPEEQQAAKEVYLQKHPGAFWVDFGDFNWFRMEVESVRFVGGFARAGAVSAQDYTQAQPDPIAAFGNAIAQHMNQDHMDATIAMIATTIPSMDVTSKNPAITEAIITSVDSLGMYVKVTRESAVAFLPQSFKCRLPFARPAQNRKDVKTLIVEMTQAAAAAKKQQQEASTSTTSTSSD